MLSVLSTVLSTLLLLLGYHKYLSITAFPQDTQQLKALRPDVLRPLVDVVLGYFDLLTVVHVAVETTFHEWYCSFFIRKHRHGRTCWKLTTQIRCTGP